MTVTSDVELEEEFTEECEELNLIPNMFNFHKWYTNQPPFCWLY